MPGVEGEPDLINQVSVLATAELGLGLHPLLHPPPPTPTQDFAYNMDQDNARSGQIHETHRTRGCQPALHDLPWES